MIRLLNNNMNCSYQPCKLPPSHFCSCNDTLSFICLNHIPLHQKNLRHNKELRLYYESDHDQIIIPFLLEQATNLTLSILKETDEAIKKITMKTTNILKGIQNIKCMMIDGYGYPMKNEEILQQARNMIEESSHDHLKLVSYFNEQIVGYLNYLPRERPQVFEETKRPSLIKILPKAYEIPNSGKIKPLPLPQEQIYPAQANSPEKINMRIDSRITESRVWYVAGKTKVYKKLPKFISDQINNSSENEILIYRENGIPESIANIKEKTYTYLTDNGLKSNKIDYLRFGA